MKDKYWYGTIELFFDNVDAKDREELEDKIYKIIGKSLPSWAEIEEIEVEDYD